MTKEQKIALALCLDFIVVGVLCPIRR